MGLERLIVANLKVTLDYFPHCERTRAMQLIGAEYKEKGDSVMWTVFEEIYMHGGGYFCEWNSDVALMFTQQPWLSVGVPVVSEIVNSMIKRGILNKDMFDKYGILTSKEIQETYFEAVKRRKNVNAIKEYLLIEVTPKYENVNIISQNVNIIGENVNIFKQIKEKEIKRNKRKENKPTCYVSLLLNDGQALSITEAEIFHFENLYPDLNVRKELVNMATWLERNPQGRRSIGKTRQFIENWLYRQAKGELSNGQASDDSGSADAPSGYHGTTVY